MTDQTKEGSITHTGREIEWYAGCLKTRTQSEEETGRNIMKGQREGDKIKRAVLDGNEKEEQCRYGDEALEATEKRGSQNTCYH